MDIVLEIGIIINGRDDREVVWERMTDGVHRAVLGNLRYDLQSAKRLQIKCQRWSLKRLGHLTSITSSPLFSEFSVHCKWAENLELVSFLWTLSFKVLVCP